MKYTILVLSDIHSESEEAVAIVRENRGCDAIFFLGDGERGFELASSAASDTTEIWQVAGNCDWYSMEQGVLFPTIGGVKICITHGHGQGVKSKAGISVLAEYAAANGCRVALFGHTHRRYIGEQQGVLLFNPGAVQSGDYGIMKIENGNITFEHRTI